MERFEFVIVDHDTMLCERIIEVLSDGYSRTVSEIQMADPELSVTAGISNSKVTSLLTKLLAEGVVLSVKDKKKTLYAIE